MMILTAPLSFPEAVYNTSKLQIYLIQNPGGEGGEAMVGMGDYMFYTIPLLYCSKTDGLVTGKWINKLHQRNVGENTQHLQTNYYYFCYIYILFIYNYN